MNWDQIEGNWKRFKGEALKQWGKLTDDDLARIEGNRQQLAGKLQESYGKTKEEVEKEIDDWLARQN